MSSLHKIYNYIKQLALDLPGRSDSFVQFTSARPDTVK
jgi:hypothetical protein